MSATDQQAAMEALGYGTAAYKLLPESVQYDIDAIVELVAAEREKARAPFLALADEWDAIYGGAGEFGLGVDTGLQRAAEAVREAAEEAQ